MTKKPSGVDQAAGTHRQRQKARTRRMIMKAAHTLFEKHGFEKTTIRAVAREAGVGLGTVMSHFPDKTTLLIHSLMDDWDAVLDRAMKRMPPGLHFRDQYLHVIGAYLRYYARRPALSRVLLKETILAGGESGRAVQEEALDRLEKGAAYVEYAKAQGQIRPDVDSLVVSRVVFGLYLQVLLEGIMEEKPSARRMLNRLAQMLDQYLEGIAVCPDKS